ALLAAGLQVVAGYGASARAQGRTDTLRLYARRDLPRPFDPNGFLWNPGWLSRPVGPPDIERDCRFRAATGHLEERTLFTSRGPCLSGDERRLVTLNEAVSTLGLGLVCATNSQLGHVRGHVNWFPITVTGQLRWDSYSKGLGADNDITLQLVPPETNALT